MKLVYFNNFPPFSWENNKQMEGILIDVLTEGGPAGSTRILIYHLYKDFFVHSKIGYAAAESLVLFSLVVGVTVIQFRTAGKKVHYQ